MKEETRGRKKKQVEEVEEYEFVTISEAERRTLWCRSTIYAMIKDERLKSEVLRGVTFVRIPVNKGC